MKTNTRILLLVVTTVCLSLLGVAHAETVVWSDNFDDGLGNNRWYADHGVWQIGSPTVGPRTNSLGGRAFSGTTCATTGLTGNYLAYEDSRLIRISSFVVPASNNYPRLRFWQWFNFASPYDNGFGNDEGSYGYVEIKAGTNNWQQVSPTYVNNGSAVWSRPSIDLTAFAGQTVQVAFHFHSAYNTAVGWYIDDVSEVTGTPLFNNPEGFELGLGDWSAEKGTWEVGVPTSGPSGAHGGSNCAATVLAGNYASYVDSRLTSPVFTVPASNNYPRLRFWHWFNFAYPYDNGFGNDEGSYGYVEIRAGTNSWQTISPQNYNDSGSGVWTCPSIDLTAYAGQTVQVAFHFHSAASTAVGWYVDDVAVVTGTPVFNNPEGFELGLGDWSAERGTWEVGVPTSGPSPISFNFNSASGFGWTFGANAGIDHNSGTWYSSAAPAPNGSQAAFVQNLPGFPASSSSIAQLLNFPAQGSYSIAFACIGRAGSHGPNTIQVQVDGNVVYTLNYTSQSQSVWQTNIATYNCTIVGSHTLSFVGVRTGGDYSSCIDKISVTGPASVSVSNPSFETPNVSGYAYQAGRGAHGGTNCAATVLAGNYASYVDSRLTSPVFTVPASNNYPRLRFWQWFNFAYPYDNGFGNDEGSYGYVEIKAGSNSWQTISPQTYNNSGSGVWTSPSIDLAPYAGQNVQVAFHFHSAYSTAVGWYVDDVAVVTGTPVFNNPEGFELGLADWSAERGTWEVGVPTSGPNSAHGGTNCAATVLAGNYASYVDSRLVSPPFVVPSSSAALRFWHWFSFAAPYDNGFGNDEGSYGYVEIKTGTNNWQGILSSTNTGGSGAWTEPFFDLSSFAGLTVRIAFHTHSAYSVASGWYVDDVSILNYISPPLITQPPTNQTVGVTSPVTFAVGVSGVGTLYYQWQFNDVPIQGATNTSYFIPSAQLSNGGNYSVIVSNSAGENYSAEALLTVLPLPWQLTNVVVNPIAQIGTANFTNGVFAITGSGEDIQGTADAFEFVCQPLTGDGQIMARVTSLVGTDGGAEAGVMIRESLYAGSTHAFVRVNANTNLVFRRRLTSDAYSIDTALAQTNHSWLRLMRIGNTFVAHCSTNGVNWEYAWFTTVNMSNQVQVGLAVTAHHDGQFATATFDNVSIGALTPLPGSWPLPGPKFVLGGETWVYSEFQRVGGYKFLLGGVVGEYDNIKATTNLALPFSSWPTLATVTNTYGVVPILDPGALTNKMKYYRAQKIGP